MFRQGGAIDNHRVEPAGFGDQRGCGVQVVGHRAADFQGGFGRAGEGYALDPGGFCEGGTHSAVAGQKLQGGGGHPGLQQEVNGKAGYQRGLLGGFGYNGIAGGQGGGDLAGEDGERKVPWADAGENAPRRGGQAERRIGIVAQEIDRLAQFGDRVGQGLASFAGQKREDRAEVGLIEVCGPVQGSGAKFGAGSPWRRQTQGGFDIHRAGRADMAGERAIGRVGDGEGKRDRGGGVRGAVGGDDVAGGRTVRGAGGGEVFAFGGKMGEVGGAVGGTVGGDMAGEAAICGAGGGQVWVGWRGTGEAGGGLKDGGLVGSTRDLDGGQVDSVGQVEPVGVLAGQEQVGAGLDAGAGGRHRLQLGQGAGGDPFGAKLDVDDLVDEAGVGTVLQQPTDQVGEQVAVGTYGRIDPAADSVFGQNDIVQAFAHAMQALEFVSAGRDMGFGGDMQDGGDGMGVVGGKLRIDPRGQP